MFYIFWNVYQCHRWGGVVGVITLSFHVSSSLVNIDYVNVVLKTRNFIVQWAAKIQWIVGVRFIVHSRTKFRINYNLFMIIAPYLHQMINYMQFQLLFHQHCVVQSLCVGSLRSLRWLVWLSSLFLQWFHLPSCRLVFIQFYFLNRCEKERDWIEQFLWLNGKWTVDGLCISKVQGTFCYVMSNRNEERFLLVQSFLSLVSSFNQPTNSCSQCSLIAWNVMMVINQLTFHFILFWFVLLFSFSLSLSLRPFSISELWTKCCFRLIYFQLSMSNVSLFHGN